MISFTVQEAERFGCSMPQTPGQQASGLLLNKA